MMQCLNLDFISYISVQFFAYMNSPLSYLYRCIPATMLLLLFSAANLQGQVYEEKEEINDITSVCELKNAIFKAGRSTMNVLRGKELEREVGKAVLWQSKITSKVFDRNLTSFGNDGGYFLGEKQLASEAEAIEFHDELIRQLTQCTGVSGLKRALDAGKLISITAWMSDYYKTEKQPDKRFFVISVDRNSKHLVCFKITSYPYSFYKENVEYQENDKFLKKVKQFKLD